MLISINRSEIITGGGTGFVGSALKHLLKNKGYDVTVISRMPGPRRVTWVNEIVIFRIYFLKSENYQYNQKIVNFSSLTLSLHDTSKIPVIF